MKSILFSILFTIAFLNCAFASQQKKIIVCTEPGYKPFEMLDSTGHLYGYEIDILRKFSKNEQYNINFKTMPFSELIPNLIKNDDCDIVAAALGSDAERKKTLLLSDPIYTTNFGFLSRAKDKDRFSNYNDIDKKTVIIDVEKGTQSEQYAKTNFPNATVVSYAKNNMPIEALLQKKADIYIDDNIMLDVIQRANPQNLYLLPQFKVNNITDNSYGIIIAFAKRNAGLKNEFNAFLGSLQLNGHLQDMQNKYFKSKASVEH